MKRERQLKPLSHSNLIKISHLYSPFLLRRTRKISCTKKSYRTSSISSKGSEAHLDSRKSLQDCHYTNRRAQTVTGSLRRRNQLPATRFKQSSSTSFKLSKAKKTRSHKGTLLSTIGDTHLKLQRSLHQRFRALTSIRHNQSSATEMRSFNKSKSAKLRMHS